MTELENPFAMPVLPLLFSISVSQLFSFSYVVPWSVVRGLVVPGQTEQWNAGQEETAWPPAPGAGISSRQ